MTRADDAYAEIYRGYAPAVFRRARRLMGSDADAQDVTHDVFLSLFERPAQYAGRSSLATFLYSATTHACLARIRKARNRQRLLETHARDAATAGGGPQPSELLELHDVLRRMPDKLARVVVYACVDQLSHAEIGALVGCSRRNVANLLEKASEWGVPKVELSCC